MINIGVFGSMLNEEIVQLFYFHLELEILKVFLFCVLFVLKMEPKMSRLERLRMGMEM